MGRFMISRSALEASFKVSGNAASPEAADLSKFKAFAFAVADVGWKSYMSRSKRFQQVRRPFCCLVANYGKGSGQATLAIQLS